MADNKRGNIFSLFMLIIIFIALIGVATYVLFTNSSSPSTPVSTDNNQQQGVQSQTDITANWQTYTNSQYGFSFKYPMDFGSKYASFLQNPNAIVTQQGDTHYIDSKGCYGILDLSNNSESQVTINNIPFCLSVAEDPGAGQLYKTRDYTTLRNGNYITLQYVVHTLNGCSPYMDTPDYSPCTDFLNNYDTNVVKVIEASVGTLQFNQ